MVRPAKRSGGRVTPKSTGPARTTTPEATDPGGSVPRFGPSTVSRQPVRVQTGSPPWVPALMFGLLLIGVAVILLNYLSVLPGAPTNWYLLVGLGAILGGILAATQYR